MVYLILTTVAARDEAHLDGAVDTAESFLAAAGARGRAERGRFVRPGRSRDEDEILRLVEFGSETEMPPTAKTAKKLEGVVRSTLDAARVASAKVKVFISEHGDVPESGRA